jgi:predicted Zn-dependent protease
MGGARAARPRSLFVFLLAAIALSHVSALIAQQPSAEQLVASAEAARQANKPAEAVDLYRQALAQRPDWPEGWWQFGTLLYDGNDYAGAAHAFERAATLKPEVGTAWVMLGLCEVQLGRKADALAHLERGRQIGVSADAQVRRVMLYQESLLLLDVAEFEKAEETLGALAAEVGDTEEVTAALGRTVLRMSAEEANEPARRELLVRAGRAAVLTAQKKPAEAEQAYVQLAADFPSIRNVHYALGRYYVGTRQPEKALDAYERELSHSPDHVPARLGIAAIKASTDPAGALTYAEQAVQLNPRIPLGHYLLGTLLLTAGQTDRAISELELAEQSVKDDPRVYYALGRAYAKAGRAADAERARATFKHLNEERQKAGRRER